MLSTPVTTYVKMHTPSTMRAHAHVCTHTHVHAYKHVHKCASLQQHNDTRKKTYINFYLLTKEQEDSSLQKHTSYIQSTVSESHQPYDDSSLENHSSYMQSTVYEDSSLQNHSSHIQSTVSESHQPHKATHSG